MPSFIVLFVEQRQTPHVTSILWPAFEPKPAGSTPESLHLAAGCDVWLTPTFLRTDR